MSMHLPDDRALSRIRLIATDVDGTLLETGTPITARVREAVEAVRETGADVVPVTGRPLRWMDPVAQQLPRLQWAICANGSAVLDMHSGHLAAVYGIDTDQLVAFRQRLHSVLPRAALAYETPEGSFTAPGFVHDSATELSESAAVRARLQAPEIAYGEEAELGTVLKVLVRVPGSYDSEALLNTVRPLARGIFHPTHSNPSSGLIELAALGITKAHTLEVFAADRGISSQEVAAFGDMPNDIEMLTWAGAGFAIADGHQQALRATAFRAPALTDGGIAPVLEAIASARSAELG
ncbi:HAD family hydrolase [Brevibacterium sp. HMSC063G07]|uniref:HAD family hydrolase n=1 Tax=Brevibacterium sp. HMSC063G07 TaxID=1739261 RepID=UPI0008BDAF88|nr:HAD family hydrolase [Brevibacterium sp. HMSC063G07]OFL67992.1 hypothetical protein HMPREF2757_08825 [Brevibacterium sp. HMSC063G07]